MFTNKQTKLEKAGKGGLTAKRRGQREGGQGDGKGGGGGGGYGDHITTSAFFPRIAVFHSDQFLWIAVT